MTRETRRPVVAVLGLGEAGSTIGLDLAHAGCSVRGWDPRRPTGLEPIALAESAGAAVARADVVLSVNAASVALGVAEEIAPSLAAGQVFAELNTAGPALKVAVAAVIEPTGALFADVALMAPVPGRGLRTPALVSGSGAARFVALFAPLGMPLELVDEQAGNAARRKLLRSVFMKGWAAAILESVEAAERAGCGAWMRAEIAAELEAADRALLVRLIVGSQRHAVRRVEEMEATAVYLHELGVEPHVAVAATRRLQALAAEAALPSAPG